jgi:hypothetical protein
MRFASSLVLALPALCIAEEQQPLFDRLKGFLQQGYVVDSPEYSLGCADPGGRWRRLWFIS